MLLVSCWCAIDVHCAMTKENFVVHSLRKMKRGSASTIVIVNQRDGSEYNLQSDFISRSTQWIIAAVKYSVHLLLLPFYWHLEMCYD